MRLYAVEQRLSDWDFNRFNGILFERKTTIDAACAWLLKHGYRISRGAVYKYRKALLLGRIRSAMASKTNLGRATYTRKLMAHCATLDVHTLAMLVRFADFVAYDGRQMKLPVRVRSKAG